MNRRNLPVLSFYYLIYFGVVATIVALFRDDVLKHMYISLTIGLFFFFGPFLVLVLTYLAPSFAKWLRVALFSYFRVTTFAKASFASLTFFCVLFVYNYIAFGVSGQQIFLNLFFLNLILLFFITLVLSNRFQIRDPAGLLIQQKGHPEVYLYRDGVLRHIPDPPTLLLLGYSFDDISVVSENEFKKYTVRPALDSVASGKLIQSDSRPEVYIIISEEKRHIPDPPTLSVIQQISSQAGLQRQIETITEDKMKQWPTGTPLISVIK